MRLPLALLGIVLALGLATQEAVAQRTAAHIWDVALGTPVGDLPPEFMITACGSNGGPPTLPLMGFEQFALCPVEPETGLREVWFSFDDEAELYLHVIRARPEIIEGNRANTVFLQLVIYSLLIDDQGLVQGHRIMSDPRETPESREDADISLSLKVVAYGATGWTCTNLPLAEGERPIGDDFRKELCERTADGRHITILGYRFLKPGQMAGRGGAPRPASSPWACGSKSSTRTWCVRAHRYAAGTPRRPSSAEAAARA